MTDPSPEEQKRSLTMQRIALDRARAFAIGAIVVGILWVLLAGALVFSGGNLPIHLAQLALGLAFLVIGVLRLTANRKEVRAFEQKNGPGAGEQKPVR